jgi:drug/metabolite transporter (DMT)-like permease
LLALVAVFAAVLEPYLSGAETLPAGHALPAAIACAAGAFLIFPVEIPRAVEGVIGFLAAVIAVAAVAAANCLGGSLLRGNPQIENSQLRLTSTLAIAAGAGAPGLALMAILRRGGMHALPGWSEIGCALVWPAAIDGPAILLLFWLMRRMPAVQMALRFVIGPLMAVAIEALALQQHLSAQTVAGLLTAAAGCWWLLRIHSQGRESPEGLRLLRDPED